MLDFPRGPSFMGAIEFCPQCYPTIGMSGGQRHVGDFSRDFDGGEYIDLFDMYDKPVTDVWRVVFPYVGTPVVEQSVMQDGQPVRCGQCGIAFLRRLTLYPGLRIVFREGFPRDRIPYWLQGGDRKPLGIPE